MLQNLYRWITQVARWIAEPSLGWLALAVTAGIPTVIFILPIPTGDQFRCSGLAFELLGIAVVWGGLRDRRILFGRQSTFDWAAGWFKRFPRFRARHITLEAGAGAMGIASAQGRLGTWKNTLPNSSINDRVAMLEANIQTLRTEQADLEQRLQQETREREKAAKVDREKQEANYKEISTKLDSLGAGNLPLEALGLFWLIVGVILSTWSSGSVSQG